MDMIFRDETHATKRKESLRQAAMHAIPLPAGLDFEWEYYSRQVFFSVYIDRLSRSCDALVPLYLASLPTQPLAASVDAVSLAFSSFQLNSPMLLCRANEKYVIAIQKLAHALCNFPSSASDQILQSVVILDMYEKMVNCNPCNQASWMSHIQGAMSLVQTQIDKHGLSPVTSQLAQRVVVALTISCGAAGIPVPDTVCTLRRKLNNASALDNIKWRLTPLLVDAVNLRAELQTKNLSCPSKIAEKARAIDLQLAQLANQIPSSWKPRRVYTIEAQARVFGRYYDIYPDHYATQTWNAIRIIRLEMLVIIKGYDPFSLVDNEESSYLQLLNKIARDICASVPQFVLPGICPVNQQPFSPLQTLRCYTLLAPLYIAAQLSSDAYLKLWIIQSLQHIAVVGRMKMAQDVADVLTLGAEISHWTIYAMAGSYAMAA
ncbi:Transcription factor dbaG [Paramyrothecium foliicola]|nr:Transcription factor dbaG [Paramyrothecium foliicola]